MIYALLALIGLSASLIAAMLGLGGSVVLIPALNELMGVKQQLHQTAAMITIIFVAGPATWRHARAGAVNGAIVKATIPTAVITVLIGVQVSELPFFQDQGQAKLAALFGLFMLAMAGLNAQRIWSMSSARLDETARQVDLPPWKSVLFIGLPSGFVAGLLGVGGGLIAVPMQNTFLKIPLRQAIGNSMATIFGMIIVGAISKNIAWASDPGHDPLAPLLLAAILVPPIVVGSLIGAKLTHTLPIRVVQAAFVLVLVVGGIRQVMRAVG